jgi:DNA-binding MarR family transcriptional regulator
MSNEDHDGAGRGAPDGSGVDRDCRCDGNGACVRCLGTADGLPQRLMGAFIRINRRHWQRRSGGELRHHEFSLLHSIRRYTPTGEDGLRAGELSEILGVSPPTVTQHVSELERRGLVERRMDSADRRSVRVALSAAGQDALEKHRAAFLALFAEVAERLGTERGEELAALLDEAASIIESLDSERTDA